MKRNLWAMGLGAAWVLSGAGSVEAGVYDQWAYRMKIRFAGYDKASTLAQFPVLVEVDTSIPGFRYDDFQAPDTGADLRFADADQTTELDYEIQRWDTNGTSLIWVRIPELSGTNDFIYAYWGNNVPAPPCTTNGSTWSGGFKGVWHLDEESGNALDATSNQYDGVVTGTARGFTGKVGAAFHFDGNGNWINTGMPVGDTVTLSTWATKEAGAQMLWVVTGSSPGPDLFFPDGTIYLNTWDGTGNPVGTEPANVTNWHHYAMVISSAQTQLYIDGSLAGAGTYKNPTGSPLYISKLGADYDWAGVIDEFHASDSARSGDWIYASWLNQASNRTFLVISDAGAVATSLMVTATAATDIGMTNATLNGTVLHAGGAENPEVSIVWDSADRGTASTSAWGHVLNLGNAWGRGDSFSATIDGLILGSNYTYRCYVTNSTGSDWSDSAETFSTIDGPSVENQTVSHISRSSAWLVGRISDTGGQAPSAWFDYWADGSATTGSLAMGVQSGSFTGTVQGLEADTLYHVRVRAANSAGEAVSGSMSFSTRTAAPVNWYVSSSGYNYDGSSWTNGFTSVQEALDYAAAGDAVLLKGETYLLSRQLVWSNAAISVIGGYQGVATPTLPGPRDPAVWPTVLARNESSLKHRVLYVTGVNGGLLKGVAVTNGYLQGPGTGTAGYNNSGAGLFITNCAGLTLADCEISGNRIHMDTGNGGWVYGAGLFSPDNSAVIVSNCVIVSNRLTTLSVSSYAHGAGGGVAALGGSWTIVDSRIADNRLQADYNVGNAFGGGLYLNGLHDIRRTVIRGNDVYGTRNEWGDGVHVAGGQCILKNCLITDNAVNKNQYHSGLFQNGGVVLLENCTVAGNVDYGVFCNAGSMAVTNAILWENGDDLFESTPGMIQLGYSIVQDGDSQGVNGCLSADPRFRDTIYYHEESPFGQYDDGYFAGGSWSVGAVISPAVDAGSPVAAFGLEPEPNGGRVNMGAYGNTAVAAVSYPIEAANRPATAIGSTGATFNGALLHLGSAGVIARFYYGETDGGSNPDDWDASVLVGELTATGAFSKVVDGLPTGVLHYYACFVSNSAGATAWGAPSASFTPVLSPAVVENRGPLNSAGPVATLRGEVVATGGETPALFVCWGATPGGTTTSSWDHAVSLGLQGGAFSTDVTVEPGGQYYYACYAVNSAGGAWSAPAVPFGVLRIRYVAADASGLGTGYTWTDAYPSLHDAMADCTDTETNLVCVKGGVYAVLTPVTWDRSHVTVRGGYEGSGYPGACLPELHPTVITNGAGAIRLIALSGVTDARLENLTLTGGNAGGGGGALAIVNATNVTVADCILRGNTASGSGGAVSVENGTAIRFRNCSVYDNRALNTSANVDGGAFHLASSDGSISNCVIERNSADSIWWQWSYIPGGGGVSILNGTWEIRDSRICYNKTIGGYRADGGGLKITGWGTHALRNCLVAQNTSLTGDGISLSGSGGLTIPGYSTSTLLLENCTFLGNTQYGLDTFWSPVTIRNCIFWRNGNDLNMSGGGASLLLEHNDIGDGDGLGVAGNISVDPRFERGLYLAADSLCVNAGTGTVAEVGLSGFTTRADGLADDGLVDMGYHFTGGMPPEKADLYVRNFGLDTDSGTDWAHAFKTLRKAFEVAVEGSRIHVEAGDYTVESGETFPLPLNRIGLRLLGTNAAVTRINAAGSGQRVVEMADNAFGRLEGVTVTGGGAAAPDMDYGSGNGIHLARACDATIASCVITSNRAGAYGAGVMVELCAGFLITNCDVTDNVIDVYQRDQERYGAGLYIYSSSGTVTDSSFIRNEGSTRYHGASYTRIAGGGMAMNGGNVQVLRTVIRDNVCRDSGSDWLVKRGGGVMVLSGSHLFRNCLIATNEAWGNLLGAPTPGLGDGIYVENGSVQMESVTVADNLGQGLYRNQGTVAVTNGIFWGNGQDLVGTVSIGYCNTGDGLDLGVNGNISADPLFVEDGYYHVRSRSGHYTGGHFKGGTWATGGDTSPCIDAGPEEWPYTLEPAFNGKRVNMGAYGNTPVASRTHLKSGTVIVIF